MPAAHRPSDLLARLHDGARLLDMQLSDHESKRLLQFIQLLLKWNRAYNLTALSDPIEMVERHLLDSLSVLPYVQGKRILDMGTGPGLPGVPLAIVRPQQAFVLLDSNSKKIRFVRQAMLELTLDNIQPVHARVERYRPNEPFDTLIARAFTELPRMLELTRGLLTPQGRLLAMKGRLPQSELARLPADLAVRITPLRVPFCAAERHLVEIRPVQ